VLILVVVLSVSLMLLSNRKKDTVARALADGALTPVQSAVDRSLDLTGLRTENDSLRVQLARATLDLGELQQRASEAAQLRQMLDFRDHSSWDLVAANVIAREAGRPGREWKIDKGAQDGVVENLAVVTPFGLVGRVSRVMPSSAWVRPLLSRNCRVSARLTRSRTDGILAWSRDVGLHLAFLPFRADVQVGDEIVSSGLGGVFPRGLRIGEVTRAEPIATEGTLRVLVRPAVDFSALEAVFVVRRVPDGSPGPEDLLPEPDAAPEEGEE
jgi:rod shape-determining protein MreC